jgi:hypothetical protein
VGKSTRAEIDKEWRELFSTAQEKMNLHKPVDLADRQLSDILLELLDSRKELDDIKRKREGIKLLNPAKSKGNKTSDKKRIGLSRRKGTF